MNALHHNEDGHVFIFFAICLLLGLVIGGAGLSELHGHGRAAHDGAVGLLVVGGGFLVLAVVGGFFGLWTLRQSDSWSNLH